MIFSCYHQVWDFLRFFEIFGDFLKHWFLDFFEIFTIFKVLLWDFLRFFIFILVSSLWLFHVLITVYHNLLLFRELWQCQKSLSGPYVWCESRCQWVWGSKLTIQQTSSQSNGVHDIHSQKSKLPASWDKSCDTLFHFIELSQLWHNHKAIASARDRFFFNTNWREFIQETHKSCLESS